MDTSEILDAINLRLLKKWPDRTVYVDVCSVDFDRPSFWLAVEEDGQTDASRFLVRRDLRLLLTIYDELDDHYDASWSRLARDADAARKLLTPPLAVGRRRLAPALKGRPRQPDRAFLQISFSWLENRVEMSGGGSAPPADSYSIRLRGGIHS